MENFLRKVKDFFTVKNSLIVIICILSLMLIFQNVHIFWWHRSSHNFGWSNYGWSNINSRGMGWVRIPGIWWGMGGNRRWSD